MKTGLLLAALTVAAATVTATVSAEDTLESKMGASATVDGGKLTLVLKGKEGVYVNTEYPFKCTLKIADGGKLEKTDLAKGDARLEDAGKSGKAKSATFVVGADKPVGGECRLVACSDSACTAPFKLPFQSK